MFNAMILCDKCVRQEREIWRKEVLCIARCHEWRCKRPSFSLQKAAFCRPKRGKTPCKQLTDKVYPQTCWMKYKVYLLKHPTLNQAVGNVFWRICNPPKITIRICNPLKPHSHEVNVWACADYKSAIRNRRIANPAEQMLCVSADYKSGETQTIIRRYFRARVFI